MAIEIIERPSAAQTTFCRIKTASEPTVSVFIDTNHLTRVKIWTNRITFLTKWNYRITKLQNYKITGLQYYKLQNYKITELQNKISVITSSCVIHHTLFRRAGLRFKNTTWRPVFIGVAHKRGKKQSMAFSRNHPKSRMRCTTNHMVCSFCDISLPSNTDVSKSNLGYWKCILLTVDPTVISRLKAESVSHASLLLSRI